MDYTIACPIIDVDAVQRIDCMPARIRRKSDCFHRDTRSWASIPHSCLPITKSGKKGVTATASSAGAMAAGYGARWPATLVDAPNVQWEDRCLTLQGAGRCRHCRMVLVRASSGCVVADTSNSAGTALSLEPFPSPTRWGLYHSTSRELFELPFIDRLSAR